VDWIEWIYLLPGLMERAKQHLWNQSTSPGQSILLAHSMVPFIGFCNWRQGYLLPVFSFGYFHIPNELAIVIVKWEYFWYFQNYVQVASICYTCSKVVIVVPLVAFTQIRLKFLNVEFLNFYFS